MTKKVSRPNGGKVSGGQSDRFAVRKVTNAEPNPNGNRAERRAAEKEQKKK